MLDVAIAFAQALDRDDFEAAGALVAGDCVYDAGGATHRGRATIMASYAQAEAWGRAHLDEVRYDSAVTPRPDGAFDIGFTDHIRCGSEAHTYRCRQRVWVSAQRVIERIEHHELDDERAQLDAFFVRCGLDRNRA